MPILMALRAALAWLGRQGTRALAASVFLGLALPQLAAYVKPYLGETVFVLLLFSYLRTDPAAFARYRAGAEADHRRRAVGDGGGAAAVRHRLRAVGLREGMPALYTIMILQCAITPITSSAAFAALMGLDVAFSLVDADRLPTRCRRSPPSPSAICFSATSLFSPIELGIKLFLFFAAVRRHRLCHPPHRRQAHGRSGRRSRSTASM